MMQNLFNSHNVIVWRTGFITGPALKTFSPRKVAIFGSFLTGTGLILSSFSDHLWEITVAYGLLVGTLSTNDNILFVCLHCSAIPISMLKDSVFSTFLLSYVQASDWDSLIRHRSLRWIRILALNVDKRSAWRWPVLALDKWWCHMSFGYCSTTTVSRERYW